MRRLTYALCSIGVFFSQHLVLWFAFNAWHQPLRIDWVFYVAPLRAAVVNRASNLVLLLLLAYLLLAAWSLAALAFRRAADAEAGEGIAAFAIAPLLQIPVILFLCVAPSHVAQRETPAELAADGPAQEWASAALGVIAGIGLTLIAVAVGALIFRTYGYGIFVVSPFIIGVTTGYLANARRDLGGSRTAGLVAGAAALGGIALVVATLEGVVCIVMAAPLGLGAAVIGGLFGRALALQARRPPRQTLSALALLPAVFVLESILPPVTSFETHESIRVDAPPAAVFRSIVDMETIDEPPALPFRLGVAYPLGGEILGHGVGAVRFGRFSTGTARERVTEWIPDRKLAFVVLDDVPAMRELSPYRHVHAPHVLGYFRTTLTSFEVLPRGNGGSEIIERTVHELRLDPVFYWLPLARWVVHENNTRVLTHLRRLAERSRVSAD
jgi:hypothetical protein